MEEYVREGRRGSAHASSYNIASTSSISFPRSAEITRRTNPRARGLMPTDSIGCGISAGTGPLEEIKPGETVHISQARSLERFIVAAQGSPGRAREPAASSLFRRAICASLDGLQLRWEALDKSAADGCDRHLRYAVAGRFQVSTADVAIEIAPGYPTSQLDMAYFYPPLRARAAPGRVRQAIEKLEGKGGRGGRVTAPASRSRFPASMISNATSLTFRTGWTGRSNR